MAGRKCKVQNGDRFGAWTIVDRAVDRKRCKARCNCGSFRLVDRYSIYSGRSRSCGCVPTKYAKTHGQTYSREYRIWGAMIRRCHNPNSDGWKWYGARGISVCTAWRRSFEVFILDMGAPPTSKHTIDRIDSKGNYTPDNCRWASWKQQARNRTNNRIITVANESRCLTEWAEISGTLRETIAKRLKLGWTSHDAVYTATRKKRRSCKDGL